MWDWRARWKLGFLIMLAARLLVAMLLAHIPATTHSATFDDGNNRHYVKELRANDLGSLTPEEKAILAAAASEVRALGLCNGENTGDAFLILYRGRPAVVTTAPEGTEVCW